jgi:hypothetical protein
VLNQGAKKWPFLQRSAVAFARCTSSSSRPGSVDGVRRHRHGGVEGYELVVSEKDILH